MPDLTDLLHATFGFAGFRANQEAVCRAATDGADVLLVMPTGAGKSLCYQLPAIARQAAGNPGAALVISPLIALMDDQAAKLTAAGLKVARIHSGLSRDDARQACRDYLDGKLNFLFIAPERMRVPGFPEMLAKRKPSLIAIDEAHCISAWGHDFRPDYRTLGEHLPALRPAPVIALTATATPTVQKDIVAQLHLREPELFIHGFRRANLAIEVVELSKPRRNEFTAKLLAEKAARPAIVYAPSRKACEELAGELGRRFPTAAYHAGLEASVRERVQAAFQSGKLEVVVATIAFGMGIDKADVRTVVHTALPASVEAYYQEIGRAGRDGKPSRTVLLHSFADRKMHEFFLERDYPLATDLARVAQVLTDDYLMPEPLAQRLKMDLGTFSKAIEKLAAQGAAALDFNGNVRATAPLAQSAAWRASYDAQIAFRRQQIDRMVAFAESGQPNQCRMLALIRHFGDTDDREGPCGSCDVCNPSGTTAQSFRAPGAEDLRQLQAILAALHDAPGQSRSTGKLYTDLAASALRNTPAGRDRKTFDTLLDALSRAALLTIHCDTFTNPEGNVIAYKKAALSHEGREAASSGTIHAADILLRDVEEVSTAGPTAKAAKSGRASKASLKAERQQTSASYTPEQREMEARLREWRKAEAAKTGKPAFMVFSDAVLHAIVVAAPANVNALLAVPGVGARTADAHGAAILALCRAETVARPKATLFAGAKEVPRAVVSSSAKVQPVAVKAPQDSKPLTPDQLALDQRLRAWRQSESEKLGLPQFFVLGSSALRSVVMERPKTLSQLQTISGIDREKAERFGHTILDLCNASGMV
jgi:ATP-dependent DNA helicase RecQ